jgi:Leucine-rich repeat (LRR) protein
LVVECLRQFIGQITRNNRERATSNTRESTQSATTESCAVRSASSLDLSYNRIGEVGTERLAGMLAQCTALAHLNLSNNGIEADLLGLVDEEVEEEEEVAEEEEDDLGT